MIDISMRCIIIASVKNVVFLTTSKYWFSVTKKENFEEMKILLLSLFGPLLAFSVAVLKLGNASRMNERCLELQHNKKEVKVEVIYFLIYQKIK